MARGITIKRQETSPGKGAWKGNDTSERYSVQSKPKEGVTENLHFFFCKIGGKNFFFQISLADSYFFLNDSSLREML